MFGCKCFCWNRAYDVVSPEPEPFSLPAPIPQWPEGWDNHWLFLAVEDLLYILRDLPQRLKDKHLATHMTMEVNILADVLAKSSVSGDLFTLGTPSVLP